jgi:hypothetical protein
VLFSLLRVAALIFLFLGWRGGDAMTNAIVGLSNNTKPTVGLLFLFVLQEQLAMTMLCLDWRDDIVDGLVVHDRSKCDVSRK